jgi:hypothetical protein
MRRLNTEHRGHNSEGESIMLIVMGKNGPVQLLADGQPTKASALPGPEERARRYAFIARRLQEEFGLEIAPASAEDCLRAQRDSSQ